MTDASAPRQIEHLLHRRSDLSTFLVHLTRSADNQSGRDRLIRILSSMTIRAGQPMGMASGPNFAPIHQSQRVVCLTETPLEHVWMLTEPIEGRSIQLEPYGLVFTKTWARRHGVNPVWYVDITPGNTWLTNPINELLDRVRHGQSGHLNTATETWEVDSFDTYPLLKVTPFIEQMGKPGEVRKEFWWEREWRHVGDLAFSWGSIMAILVPEADQQAFCTDLESLMSEQGDEVRCDFHLLDPQWGLERMIAALAGVSAGDVGPFPN